MPYGRGGGGCPLVAQRRSEGRQAPPGQGDRETRDLVTVGVRDLVTQQGLEIPEVVVLQQVATPEAAEIPGDPREPLAWISSNSPGCGPATDGPVPHGRAP